MDSALDLLTEPRGPFRFSVWQPEPEVYTIAETQYFNHLNAQIQICETLSNGEAIEIFTRRFLTDRSNLTSDGFSFLLSAMVVLFELAGVSEPGVQQILRHTISQGQAIANDERNSNQSIIPLNLRLERRRWLRSGISGDADADPNEFANEFYDAMNRIMLRVLGLPLDDSTYNPVPATKSSIEALEKVRLEDGSSASKELCMICMERLSFMVEVTRMPCSHLYHGDCIVQWLNTSHSCPLCRFPMPRVNP